MGMRIHSVAASAVGVEYADNNRIVEVYDDEMEGVGPGLIIEDAGNLEAFVLSGTPEAVRAFALRVIAATDSVPTFDVDFTDNTRELTPDERSYLEDVCGGNGWDVDDGDFFYDERTNIQWWDSPDCTSFDLTNELCRSRSIEAS